MSKTQVVVVDDSPVVLAMVVETLERAGISALSCDNPIMIAGLLRVHEPQVLILDVDMPGLSGPQAVEILRRNDALANTRVLLFSSRPADELRALARQCGAVDSLPKGDNEALVRVVRQHATQASSARLQRTDCLVFTRDPTLEARLLSSLKLLGRAAEGRGTVGIDRAVRESTATLLVLEDEAFSGGVQRALDRLERRGLLENVQVLVIGERAPGLQTLLRNFSTEALSLALEHRVPTPRTSEGA